MPDSPAPRPRQKAPDRPGARPDRPAPRPLAGVRVLDLSRLLPGPMATLHLADLGAEVIRIEPVGAATPPAGPLRVLDLLVNRGKRAIRLDVRGPAGRDIFLRLARDADVIVEGFRPGVVDRWGIGYEAVRSVQPRVVYCSISGYGQTGPDRLRAGHDINYLGCSGVADQIGVGGGPPAIPNLQIGDLLGGSLTAVMGILAALHDARARGIGHYVDVSMTDSLLAHSVLALAALTAFGGTASRGQDIISGGLACYNYYRAQDGRYLAVGALESKFWERLCDALDRPDLKSRHLARGEEAERTRRELQAIFRARPAAEWVRVLADADCCVGPVLTLAEAMASAQTQAREMVVESGERKRFASPLKMDGARLGAEPVAPPSAPQTRKILAEAGYLPGEIEDFVSTGVAG